MEIKTDAIFPRGIYFDRPHTNAPEFIKGKLNIKVDDAIAFLKEHQNARGYVNLDLKKSRDGKLYLQLNTFVADMTRPESIKPKESYTASAATPRTDELTSDGKEQPDFESYIDPKDVPF